LRTTADCAVLVLSSDIEIHFDAQNYESWAYVGPTKHHAGLGHEFVDEWCFANGKDGRDDSVQCHHSIAMRRRRLPLASQSDLHKLNSFLELNHCIGAMDDKARKQLEINSAISEQRTSNIITSCITMAK
jgi:hypothetical protein